MSPVRRISLVSAGILLLLLGWHFSAVRLGELVMATPQQAWSGMLDILASPGARQQLMISVGRMAEGILLGCVIGVVLGVAAGFSRTVRMLLLPLRWFLMAIPPIVLVVLAMLWLGLGGTLVVFITATLLTPGVYVNTEKAVRMVDPRLLEMARVYRFSLWQRLIRLYIPAIAAPLSAALLIALCSGVRIVVMAEVLGSENGIGYEIAAARSNFDSYQLYGWVLIVLLLVGVSEWLILRPLQYRLTRWQKEADHAPA